MKVLFVSSSNHKFGIGPIVKAQGDSLIKNGVELEYFSLRGKGLRGYIKNIFSLRKYLKSKNFDLVHSHFFLSSVVATLGKPSRLVVSLMGSDVYKSSLWRFLINLFQKRWDALIVKSERMKQILGSADIHIIPNGVDFEKFYPISKHTAQNILGWKNKKYILVVSSSGSPAKNFELAKGAIEILKDLDVELVTLKHIPHDQVVYYLNAADIMLMTSIYEGSPNIIKEAMACNCPVVSTDVGDVKWVIGNIDGCYLTSFDPIDVAEKIKMALHFSKKVGRTIGRDRIIELKLDSETVAKKIISIYNIVINS